MYTTNNLLNYLDYKGITSSEMAKRLHIRKPAMSNYTNGRSVPVKTGIDFCKLAYVTLDQFYTTVIEPEDYRLAEDLNIRGRERKVNFGSKNLNYLISITGGSLKQFASQFDISDSVLNSWCYGSKVIDVDKAIEITDHFNMTLDDFYKKDIRSVKYEIEHN